MEVMLLIVWEIGMVIVVVVVCGKIEVIKWLFMLIIFFVK